MTPDHVHEQIQPLLAAYALNAVDADERTPIEEHIPSCGECRAELAEHLEASLLLARTTAQPDASPELWKRIEERLGASPPPLRLTEQKRHSRWLGVPAVAAAVLILFAVVQSVAQRDPSSNAQLADAASTAAGNPAAREVVMRSGDGAIEVNLVLLPDGVGYLLDDNLPPLEEGRTYQLWAMMSSTPISAGVLGSDPGVASFVAAGGPTAFAITVEPAGGVLAPGSEPVASGVV